MSPRTRRPKELPRLGKQQPRYCFFLNLYMDIRFTTCPQCLGKTLLRKLPLLIHRAPVQLIALNKHCRYCPRCDLLIVHRDEIEAFLAAFLGDEQPLTFGEDYMVVGTLDRADWRRGMRTPPNIPEMLERLHDFSEIVTFEIERGWALEPKQAPKRRPGGGNG